MIRPDLCLDFANTRYWRPRAEPTETLGGPDDLAAWAAGNVSKDARPPSKREFDRALELREAIYRLFDATSRRKAPAPDDLEALNQALGDAPSRNLLKREKNGFSWDVDMRGGTALSMLAPVLWSAGDLLAGGKLDKVKRCANPECGWLYLDDSRAGRRRWCSMQACGNRAKARRHYFRVKEES